MRGNLRGKSRAAQSLPPLLSQETASGWLSGSPGALSPHSCGLQGVVTSS